jgi:hypothetical protein
LVTFTKNISFENEINFALENIKKVPNNESPYSYIRGLISPLSKIIEYPQIKSTLEEIVLNNPDCYHACSLLLDIAEQDKNFNVFSSLINKLIEIDSIRKKYWGWRNINFINNRDKIN